MHRENLSTTLAALLSREQSQSGLTLGEVFERIGGARAPGPRQSGDEDDLSHGGDCTDRRCGTGERSSTSEAQIEKSREGGARGVAR